MPAKTVKVAVSLPVEQYRQVERTRKDRKISRSAVIGEALNFWSEAGREEEKIRAYVAGYRRRPETVREVKPFEEMATAVLASEEWKA